MVQQGSIFGVVGSSGNLHCLQCPRSPSCSSPALRKSCSSGVLRSASSSRQLRRCSVSARQLDDASGAPGPEKEDPVDAEWRRHRVGALWASLSEQDRSWAVTSFAEEDSNGSGSASATLDGSLDTSDSALATRWPSAKPASYSGPLPGQEARLKDLRKVYVILFGAGTSDTEGIYSLRVMSREDGLPQDTIVAFAAQDDAERYAGLLEATMEHTPTVCPIEPSELLDFCSDSGYSYRVEEVGTLLIPPCYYVSLTDWERSLRLREGKWTVQARNEVPQAGTPSPTASLDVEEQPSAEPLNNAITLEQQRAALERLAALGFE